MKISAKRSAGFIALFAAVALVVATPVFAADPDDDEGIPAYAIARLKVLAGSAWVKTADGGDWEEATTNTPLTPNSRVSLPEGSEGEVQFHGGQFVLLTAGTDLEVREMAEDKTGFRLRAGEIRFDLPGDDFAPVSVRVPGGSRARFPEPGRYWLTVTDEDTTRLVVRRGKASVSLEGATYRVNAGQEAEIGREITLSNFAGGADPAPPPEMIPEDERSAKVPPVVHGELSEYGEWVQSPTYGYVWRPRVSVGWTPYTYGRWAWIAPYGWTWVSYEPWGWYPYHSGYWVSDLGFGWVWTPYGSFVSIGIGFDWGRPHHYHRDFRYRPSNVRFIPDGRDVRWAPLRPGERYRSYRTEYSRDDSRLRQWNRPLENNRVFVRPRAAAGAPQREWRDVTVVRTERNTSVRTAPVGGPRKDARPVRPELQRAPSGDRPAVQRPAVQRPEGQRPAVQQRPLEQKRDVEQKRAVEQKRPAAEQKRVMPAPPASAPAPGPKAISSPPDKAPVSRETAPRVITPRDSPPPARESAPRVAPPRESAPVREIERAPAQVQQAPGRSIDVGEGRGGGEGTRGNGGGRGGGDRGGGDRGGEERGGRGTR